MTGSLTWVMGTVMLMTLAIHTIETLQHGVSFVGLKTRRLATAGTLFGMVLLISRTANMVQAVLMASLVDDAAEGKIPIGDLVGELRWVLLAATAGSLLGAALLPTFVRYMTKGVEVFVRYGSYSGLVGAMIRRGGLKSNDLERVVAGLSKPTPKQIRGTPFQGIPKSFFLTDVLVTAFFTVSVVACNYAGALVPENRSATGAMSGVANGIATTLLFLLISPRVSKIIDDALNDPKRIVQVRAMAITLATGKILGTLVAQVLLYPMGRFIAFLACHL